MADQAIAEFAAGRGTMAQRRAPRSSKRRTALGAATAGLSLLLATLVGCSGSQPGATSVATHPTATPAALALDGTATCDDGSQDVREGTKDESDSMYRASLRGYSGVDLTEVRVTRAVDGLDVAWTVADASGLAGSGELLTVVIYDKGRPRWFITANSTPDRASHPVRVFGPRMREAITVSGSFTPDGARAHVPLAALKGLPDTFEWSAETFLIDSTTALPPGDTRPWITATDYCPGLDDRMKFPAEARATTVTAPNAAVPSSQPLPHPSKGSTTASSMHIVLEVSGCESCKVKLVQASQSTPGYWSSSEDEGVPVENGRVEFTVPTKRTRGMSFEIRPPWEISQGGIDNIVTRYTGTPALQKAYGCWKGSREATVTLHVTVKRVRVEGSNNDYGTYGPAAVAYFDPSIAPFGKSEFASEIGTIGNSDAFYC